VCVSVWVVCVRIHILIHINLLLLFKYTNVNLVEILNIVFSLFFACNDCWFMRTYIIYVYITSGLRGIIMVLSQTFFKRSLLYREPYDIVLIGNNVCIIIAMLLWNIKTKTKTKYHRYRVKKKKNLFSIKIIKNKTVKVNLVTYLLIYFNKIIFKHEYKYTH